MSKVKQTQTSGFSIKEMPHGSVCFPRGYLAWGMNCGIKMTKKDLAMIVCEDLAKVAGTFTTHAFAAAPVRWCRDIVKKGSARAVIVNSGNANACTGEGGFRDSRKTARIVASELGIQEENILVSSTGVIGKRLPMDTLETGIKKIVKLISPKGDTEASQAIMTTDTFPKTVAVEFDIAGKKVRMGAIAKGAGMIQPNMATMLCYITTDAAIELPALRSALKQAVDKSFNCITVDGDMSTNDSVILFANGRAENREIVLGSPEFGKFLKALQHVTKKLAKLIVKDGEGATKLVEIRVTGALNDDWAKKGAYAIANSNLFKVSLYAGDPNWGRLMAALGSIGIPRLISEKVSVKINGRFFVAKGKSSGVKLSEGRKIFRSKDLDIDVNLGVGKGQGVVWTCDLTHKYVDINM